MNFADWNGYQPPFTSIDPDRLDRRRASSHPRCRSAVVGEEDFKPGYIQSELTARGRPDLARRVERDPGRWLAPRRRRGAAKRRRERSASDQRTGVDTRRWYWPAFTASGLIWLLVLFVLPFYVVVSVAFGTVDPFFRTPLPVYQPWWWSFSTFTDDAAEVLRAGGVYFDPLIRTLVYVVAASAICLVIGYAVAYYTARFAREAQGPDPRAAGRAVLDQLPDADLRVAEPAAARRLHQRLPAGSSGSRRSNGWPASPSR